jgi:hypothetical protein
LLISITSSPTRRCGLPESASGCRLYVLNVSGVPWYDVNNMLDCLARGFPYVDRQIVPIGSEPDLELITHHTDCLADRSFFRFNQIEEIGFMPAWRDKHMTRADGEGIKERDDHIGPLIAVRCHV